MLRLDVKIRNGQQLATIMNKLNQIAGVMQVTRPAG
jgi:(p)ppGpp synthase/HD superfamily hydrolase